MWCELLQLVDHSEKSTDTADICRFRHVDNCFDLVLIWADSRLIDGLAQELDFLNRELTFLRVQCDILFLESSKHFTEGNRLKQNLPKGVMKVVSKADSYANGTCQKPEFASSFENILASDNCPRVYSTEGISCRSRRTLSFSFVKSTQILTSSFFRTTTMGAHQSVGSSTLTITPVSSIILSAFFVLSISGKATRLGTLIAKGWA